MTHGNVLMTVNKGHIHIPSGEWLGLFLYTHDSELDFGH